MKKDFGEFWVEAIAYQNDLAAFTLLLVYTRDTRNLINVITAPAMIPKSRAAARADAADALSRVTSVTADGELVFDPSPIFQTVSTHTAVRMAVDGEAVN